VVRHAHAGERSEAAAALEARDAAKRRATACAEGALATAQVLHLHLVGHEHLPIAPEKYDPQTHASTKGTGPNSLTQSVDDPDLTLAQARETAHERALGRHRGLLLALAE
jgi:hypothetical protein